MLRSMKWQAAEWIITFNKFRESASEMNYHHFGHPWSPWNANIGVRLMTINMKGQSEIAYLPKYYANDYANDDNDDACKDDLTYLKWHMQTLALTTMLTLTLGPIFKVMLLLHHWRHHHKNSFIWHIWQSAVKIAIFRNLKKIQMAVFLTCTRDFSFKVKLKFDWHKTKALWINYISVFVSLQYRNNWQSYHRFCGKAIFHHFDLDLDLDVWPWNVYDL